MVATNEEISLLIYIADSNPIAMRRERHWWSLGLPVRHSIYPTLDEQLVAIGDLGKSASPDALKYLEKISQEESWYHSYDAANSCGDSWGSVFLNAKGQLGSALMSVNKNPECPELGNKVPRDERAYSILMNALDKLKTELNSYSN